MTFNPTIPLTMYMRAESIQNNLKYIFAIKPDT